MQQPRVFHPSLSQAAPKSLKHLAVQPLSLVLLSCALGARALQIVPTPRQAPQSVGYLEAQMNVKACAGPTTAHGEGGAGKSKSLEV